MAAEFVKPFRKSQGAKNDRNDAQAILTAVRQARHAICQRRPKQARYQSDKPRSRPNSQETDCPRTTAVKD